MLQTALVLLAMGITCSLLGYGILSLLNRPGLLTEKPLPIRQPLPCLLAGTVAATIYAQLFSLFHGVGLAADLGLAAICLLILWGMRRQITEDLTTLRSSLSPGKTLSLLLLFLAAAYGTSHGIMHYDTGLYHAQSIRFVEEYGVIPGLANLHSRLGYNSAVFPLTALYSFSCLCPTSSLHVTSGYFAFLLGLACLPIGHLLKRERPVLTDFVRFAGLYYLFNIFKEMVAPASDYALNCFLFCLLILWVDLEVRGEREVLPYALLSCGVVYAVTIKLSAAALLFLAIRPIVRILRERTGAKQAAKMIGRYVLLGILIALPWFLRNALISGWLLYPSTVIGIPGAVWQVPRDLAEGDAAGIRAYARGTDGPLFSGGNPGLPTWFPVWLAAQPIVARLLLLFDLAAVPACPIIQLIRTIRGKKAPVFPFTEGVLLLSFLFWFTQSPLIRYGFFFVWAPVFVIGGRLFLVLFDRLAERPAATVTRVLALMFLAFILYKGVRLVLTDGKLMRPQYLLTQQEYDRFDVFPYERDGVTFYRPVSGDQTGYAGYPGGPYEADIRLLGKNLRNGLACSSTDRSPDP